jgi:hypothetical protein
MRVRPCGRARRFARTGSSPPSIASRESIYSEISGAATLRAAVAAPSTRLEPPLPLRRGSRTRRGNDGIRGRKRHKAVHPLDERPQLLVEIGVLIRHDVAPVAHHNHNRGTMPTRPMRRTNEVVRGVPTGTAVFGSRWFRFAPEPACPQAATGLGGRETRTPPAYRLTDGGVRARRLQRLARAVAAVRAPRLRAWNGLRDPMIGRVSHDSDPGRFADAKGRGPSSVVPYACRATGRYAYCSTGGSNKIGSGGYSSGRALIANLAPETGCGEAPSRKGNDENHD